MATYTYPTATALREIEQELLPAMTMDDAIFDEFPIVEVAETKVKWEQEDNYTGLQQVRGMNGLPGKVAKTGAKQYEYEPGVYGEFETIEEKELTERRALGQFTEFISLGDIVARLQGKLLVRRNDRIRKNLWDLLTAGVFTSTNDAGQTYHSDTFPLKTHSAAVDWSTFATATPFADIRGAVLKQRGQSVAFGRQAKMYMNQQEVNNLLQNINPNDMFGRRLVNSTINSLEDVNSIFGANDLPAIVPYDRGYISDAGTFTPFIPDGKAVLVGARTNGAKLGEYRMTRNANNPNAEPGAYTRVIDHGENRVPRSIEVHDGHNGGPIIWFPGAIVSISI